MFGYVEIYRCLFLPFYIPFYDNFIGSEESRGARENLGWA